MVSYRRNYVKGGTYFFTAVIQQRRPLLTTPLDEWPWSSFHRYVRLGEYLSDRGSADQWYGDEWRKFE